MSGSPPATLTLGGGCFWCLEAVFELLPGVTGVVSGYAGGTVPSPSYEAVCTGETGHAEVVQIHYDPAQISHRRLLEYFFACHDPTTRDRQGGDVGSQYRSIILTGSAAEAEEARALIAELEQGDVFGGPIVTELVPLSRFWPAEAEHQGYFRRHPERGYCVAVIAPKVAALRRHLAGRA